MSAAKQESMYAEEGSHVTRVNVELGSATIAIVVSLMLIIGACGVVMGMNLAKQSQLDANLQSLTRIYERNFIQLTDMQALLLREGLAQPGDFIHGPAGNLEYKPKKDK